MASFVFTQTICTRPVLIRIYSRDTPLPDKHHNLYEDFPQFRWCITAQALDDRSHDCIQEWLVSSAQDDLLLLLNNLHEQISAEFLGQPSLWIQNLRRRPNPRDN